LGLESIGFPFPKFYLWHRHLACERLVPHSQGASQRSKKNRSGSVSLPRDLIGSETLPLLIYENEMLPIYILFKMAIWGWESVEFGIYWVSIAEVLLVA
jgi:hypothetical protein